MGATVMKWAVITGLGLIVAFEVAFTIWDYKHKDRKDG